MRLSSAVTTLQKLYSLHIHILLSTTVALVIMYFSLALIAEATTATSSASSTATTTETTATTTHTSTTATTTATTTTSTSTIPTQTNATTTSTSTIPTNASTTATTTATTTTNSGGSTSDTQTESITLTIRNGSTVILTATHDLPTGGIVPITPTAGSNAIDIDARSVLAALVAEDTVSNSFTISDLQYYSSFGAFFLNCITVAGDNLCGSWQYTVNGTYPSVGLDQHNLNDGDTVYLFFGSPRLVQSPAQVSVGSTFTATAVEYDPARGEYEPVPGYTIGVIQENPDNPWSPTEITTNKTDNSGEVTFTLDTLGSYQLGIQEDYYNPTVPLEVVENSIKISSGGSSHHVAEDLTFDTEGALAFIESVQHDDGSFAAPLYSDWAAIALAAGTHTNTTEKVRDAILASESDYNYVTDHERRAMALMALNVNPYSDSNTDHIAAITNSFNGYQIGDSTTINDDIFALIVLTYAGYTTDDKIIAKEITHILAEQESNGSWENTDLTAAAVQALAPYTGVVGVSAALNKARLYLASQQQDDGGFGNSFTTSWVIQAVVALTENPEDWQKNDNSPLDYLAATQEDDGGVESYNTAPATRLWATSYAVPAALRLPWSKVLHHFPRPSVLGESTTKISTVSTSGHAAPRTTELLTTPSRNTNFKFASDAPIPQSVIKDTPATPTPSSTTSTTKPVTPPTNEPNDHSKTFTFVMSILVIGFGALIFFRR